MAAAFGLSPCRNPRGDYQQSKCEQNLNQVTRIQSSSCLSDIDVRLSQVYLLLSEINQIISKCPEPVQSRQLLPRVDVILSEMTWIVTQSQEDGSAVDGDDSYVSLNWDTYNHSNYYNLFHDSYNNSNQNLSFLFDTEEEDEVDIIPADHGEVDMTPADHGEDDMKLDAPGEDDDHAEEDMNIAERVMLRRRSSNPNTMSIVSSGTSREVPVSKPKQAISFIDEMLSFMSRVAPKDIFSMKKSRRRKMKKMMKSVHKELRNVFKYSLDIFTPAPVPPVPDQRPPVPVVDWTRVNQRGLGNLPTPQMFPKLGCSDDPNIYAERIRDHGAHGRISSGTIHAKERFPFGLEYGLMTDLGLISTNKGDHMEDPYQNTVQGHVWSRDLCQWVIHAKLPQAYSTNKKNVVKKQKALIFPKKSRRRELR